MEQLNGKRIMVVDCTGAQTKGLCTGCSEDFIKIVPDCHSDERVFLMRSVVSYEVVGGGVTGGYSGLKTFICKNEEINCAGRVMLGLDGSHITDMGCPAIAGKGAKFKCDFACIGAMEVIPPQVQRALFGGMVAERGKKKNYLADARREIASRERDGKEEPRR